MLKPAFWLVLLTSILFLAALVFDAILPFMIAFVFAYLLRPLAVGLSKKLKISNSLVVYITCIILIIIILLACAILLPILYKQITLLITTLKNYSGYLQNNLIPLLEKKLTYLDVDITDKVSQSLTQLFSKFTSVVVAGVNNIWDYTRATFNIILIILLVPVILIYFLRDWTIITSNLEGLIPIKNKSYVMGILNDINNLISTYIRGQFNVCLLLMLYYSISLSLVGINSSLVLGIIAGFLIIIPIIGTAISIIITMIVGFLTFGHSVELIYILLIYIIGHILESYLITPKIIGDKIGLHPLWIIFSVFASGSLFGFWGVLFAIPLAGIVKILLSHMIQSYKKSSIYK